ncbi:MAG TPA: sulfite exporter TauE/SafE family protein [Spirochaetia bacterium]|nr:sulfite exporter TauE/SafE family protein [Spirochaetia bacterium]
MTTWELSSILVGASAGAGFLGSLTGLGGGIIVIPLLTIVLGVDIRYAVGASLVSVIATSSGAAAAYVREGFSNIRIGMFLEVATTLGALGGAVLALHLGPSVIAVVFGLMLLYSAAVTFRTRSGANAGIPPDRLATRLRLNGSFPVPEGTRQYNVRNVPAGFSLMALAGVLSGLLGIGSGALKVIAMDRVMRIPFKVSTTTSNFMIGVTAAASAGVYLHRGYIDPVLALPVMVGVLGGSLLGARLLTTADTRTLRIVFAVAITGIGVEMIIKGFTGRM